MIHEPADETPAGQQEPDNNGRHLKQERLAEMTGMSQRSMSDYDVFGHFIGYSSTPAIKPTLLQPLFFERLTLTLPGNALEEGDGQQPLSSQTPCFVAHSLAHLSASFCGVRHEKASFSRRFSTFGALGALGNR
jgi:hypothetical protein